MIRTMLGAFAAMAALAGPVSGQELLDGTWKLIKSTRTTSATGATVDTFGANPKGFITYGKDGRMMAIIVRGDRPKPENPKKVTDAQRSALFSSMMAYAGTYRFDGKTIVHQVDASWNEMWTGTVQTREVRKEGDRLIYTTKPGPSPVDGSMGFATLIWERVK